MQLNPFEILQSTIRNRRSVSWAKMNGAIIPNEIVNSLLSLADWAPTHGNTEPWRFYVYTGQALTNFAKAHADLYWNNTPEEKRQQSIYDKIEHNVDKVSHLLVSVMKRGNNPKIPLIEEIAAASAAVQNLLLGASALGVSALWSTGGLAHSPFLKKYLGLGEEDIILGLIFLGYTDEPVKEGIRKIPLHEKVQWFEF